MQLPGTTGGWRCILNRTREAKMEIRVKTLNPVALTCALALLLVLSAGTTAAQSITGSIFGSVLDSTGSAVQGAQLRLGPLHHWRRARRANRRTRRICLQRPGPRPILVDCRGARLQETDAR